MAQDENAGKARETDVQESDPNADSAAGLAGEMGISSERVGPLRGAGEGTYGAEHAKEPAEDEEAPPEQSADPRTGEVNPDNDLPEHPFDPGAAAGHSHG